MSQNEVETLFSNSEQILFVVDKNGDVSWQTEADFKKNCIKPQ